MNIKESDINLNLKFRKTINWMVEILSTFYPMSASETEHAKSIMTKTVSDFINGCEHAPKPGESDDVC